MNITTIGLDLAKNVFQVHAVDQKGRVIARKKLRRSMVKAYFAKLPPCLVGMEACGSAHHWARELNRLGHDVPPLNMLSPMSNAARMMLRMQRPSAKLSPVRPCDLCLLKQPNNRPRSCCTGPETYW